MVDAAQRNSHLDFCLARADQARGEAEVATLAHVRERCLRSAAAWSAMADRARRSEELKLVEAERKAQAGLTS